MTDKELVRNVLVGGFLLFVGLPMVSQAMSLLRSPSSTEDAVSLIESVAVPWWIDFAIAVPALFVAFLFIVQWAGAEEVL